MTTRLPLRLCLVLIILFCCRLCFADGIFIPTAVRQFPDIPVQRALVKYVDGVQTLVIESTLDGEDDRYSWIVPVPAVPHRLEKISPGLLQTLSLQLAPEIEVLTSRRQNYSFITYASVIIICICFLLKGWRGALVIPLVAMLWFVILPRFISYGDSSSGTFGVTVISTQTVGEYETFVIEAETSDDLNYWLADNDFLTFPDDAIPVIDDYIEKQWVFFAAKLTEEEAIRFAPHPILLEFATDTPVYPMRLTALQDADLDLELFLLSGKQMVPVNYDLRKEFCNTFFLQDTTAAVANDNSASRKRFVSRHAPGSRRFRRALSPQVGHSDAFRIFWDGCVVTKYIGKIPVERMTEDMTFRFQKPVAYRHLIRVAESKDQAILEKIVLPIFFLIGLPILTIGYRITRAHASLRRMQLPIMAVLFFLLVVACIIASVLSDIQQIGTTETSGDTPAAKYVTIARPRVEWQMFHEGISQLFQSFDRLDEMVLSDEELEEALVNSHSEYFRNPFTGAAVIVEDSPGNVTPVRENGVITGLHLYRSDGSAYYQQLYDHLGNLDFDRLFWKLNDRRPAIRRKAVLELERRGDPVAIEPLEALFDDRDRQVRYLAYIAVARISKDPEMVEHLVDMLADEDRKIRISAADALGEITGRDFGEDPHQWRSWWEQNSKASSTEENNPPELQPIQGDSTRQSPASNGQSEVQLLIGKLKHPNWQVRQEAADRLAEIRNPAELQPAVQPLLEALAVRKPKAPQPTARPLFKRGSLNYEHRSLRLRYIEILGNSMDPRAVDPLLELLATADSKTQIAAVNALEKMKDNRVVEGLVVALSDPQRSVRKSAVDALGKLGDDRAAEGLIVAVSDPQRSVRQSAVKALAKLGDDRAVEGLIVALSDPQRSARRSAVDALVEIRHPDGIDALLSRLNGDYPEQGYILSVLVRMKEPRVIEPMIEMLRHPDPKRRSYAMGSILRMTGEDFGVVDGLLVLLTDEDRRNRLTAAKALGKLKDDRSVEGLIVALSDEWPPVRELSIIALGKIGHPDGIDALLVHLHSGYPERYHVLNALLNANEPRAIEPMIEMLREPNLSFHNYLLRSLSRMTGQDFGDDADRWQIWWDDNKDRLLAEGS